MKEQPIGIFDSGVGGLTVAHAIKQVLPGESLIYFGDTAHLPYGDKSAESIRYYSQRITEFLLEHNSKVVLIACNSASASAFESLKKEFENKLITSLIEQSTMEFPPVLIEKEIDNIVNEEARNFADGVKGLENYLGNAKKTIEQHREDLRAAATDRVKAYLITSKIAEEEKIEISDDELNEAIESMVKGDEAKAENVRGVFSMPEPRASLRNMLAINKTMDLLTKMVTGQDDKPQQ
ncbi:MAG: hypothetical protein ABSA18_14345 [Dehalococcoidia bacterium]